MSNEERFYGFVISTLMSVTIIVWIKSDAIFRFLHEAWPYLLCGFLLLGNFLWATFLFAEHKNHLSYLNRETKEELNAIKADISRLQNSFSWLKNELSHANKKIEEYGRHIQFTDKKLTELARALTSPDAQAPNLISHSIQLALEEISGGGL